MHKLIKLYRLNLSHSLVKKVSHSSHLVNIVVKICIYVASYSEEKETIRLQIIH